MLSLLCCCGCSRLEQSTLVQLHEIWNYCQVQVLRSQLQLAIGSYSIARIKNIMFTYLKKSFFVYIQLLTIKQSNLIQTFNDCCYYVLSVCSCSCMSPPRQLPLCMQIIQNNYIMSKVIERQVATLFYNQKVITLKASEDDRDVCYFVFCSKNCLHLPLHAPLNFQLVALCLDVYGAIEIKPTLTSLTIAYRSASHAVESKEIIAIIKLT